MATLDAMTALFQGAAEATEEAMLNALTAAEIMPVSAATPRMQPRSTVYRKSCANMAGTDPQNAGNPVCARPRMSA
jgi:hypothetical protein